MRRRRIRPWRPRRGAAAWKLEAYDFSFGWLPLALFCVVPVRREISLAGAGTAINFMVAEAISGGVRWNTGAELLDWAAYEIISGCSPRLPQSYPHAPSSRRTRTSSPR